MLEATNEARLRVLERRELCQFHYRTENFFCEKSVFDKDNLYRLLSFNESFGFHTEIFLVFEFLYFEIFLVSKCTLKSLI